MYFSDAFSLPFPPFLVCLRSDSIVLVLPSRLLASSPSLSNSFASSFFQLLVTMIQFETVKLSLRVHSFTLLPVAYSLRWNGGGEEYYVAGRDKLMRKDRNLLVSAAKFP